VPVDFRPVAVRGGKDVAAAFSSEPLYPQEHASAKLRAAAPFCCCGTSFALGISAIRRQYGKQAQAKRAGRRIHGSGQNEPGTSFIVSAECKF